MQGQVADDHDLCVGGGIGSAIEIHQLSLINAFKALGRTVPGAGDRLPGVQLVVDQCARQGVGVVVVFFELGEQLVFYPALTFDGKARPGEHLGEQVHGRFADVRGAQAAQGKKALFLADSVAQGHAQAIKPFGQGIGVLECRAFVEQAQHGGGQAG